MMILMTAAAAASGPASPSWAWWYSCNSYTMTLPLYVVDDDLEYVLYQHLLHCNLSSFSFAGSLLPLWWLVGEKDSSKGCFWWFFFWWWLFDLDNNCQKAISVVILNLWSCPEEHVSCALQEQLLWWILLSFEFACHDLKPPKRKRGNTLFFLLLWFFQRTRGFNYSVWSGVCLVCLILSCDLIRVPLSCVLFLNCSSLCFCLLLSSVLHHLRIVSLWMYKMANWDNCAIVSISR